MQVFFLFQESDENKKSKKSTEDLMPKPKRGYPFWVNKKR